MSTLQASCQLCMDTFESRCQTAESLRNFKTELGRAKAAYAPATDFNYGNGWRDPHKPKPAERKDYPPEEIKQVESYLDAEERKQVEPYLNTCLDFIGMMIRLATTNELDENERREFVQAPPFKKSYSHGNEDGLTIAMLKDIEDVLGRAQNTAEKFAIFEALQENRTAYDTYISEKNKPFAYRSYMITLLDHLKRNVKKMLTLVEQNDRVVLESIIHFLDFSLGPALHSFANQNKTIQQILSDEMKKYENARDEFIGAIPAKVEEVDRLPGWRQELQVALDENKVDFHKTWISLKRPEERMEVTQIYRKVDKTVLCCIIPWDVARRRSGNDQIYYTRNQCIMLWPDRSVDVYNSMDMTCVGNVGSVREAFNNNDVWKELWTCYVMRWEPKQDLDGIGVKADLRTLLCRLQTLHTLPLR